MTICSCFRVTRGLLVAMSTFTWPISSWTTKLFAKLVTLPFGSNFQMTDWTVTCLKFGVLFSKHTLRFLVYFLSIKKLFSPPLLMIKNKQTISFTITSVWKMTKCEKSSWTLNISVSFFFYLFSFAVFVSCFPRNLSPSLSPEGCFTLTCGGGAPCSGACKHTQKPQNTNRHTSGPHWEAEVSAALMTRNLFSP